MIQSSLLRGAVDTLRRRFDAGGYAFTPIIDLGALVVGADGKVAAGEIETFQDLFDGMLGSRVSRQTVEHLLRASLQVIEEAGVVPRVQLLGEILMDCDAAREGLTVAYGVAIASDSLGAPEQERIGELGRAAGLGDADLAALRKQVADDLGRIAARASKTPEKS